MGPAQHRAGRPAPPGLAGADIGAPAAWGVTTGSSSVNVAVVDSGVDRTHPDLFANLAAGYDFAYDDSDPTDYDGHGTHVAGIIAARGNNGIGVTGVAWQTSVIPVEALDATGEGTTSDIVAAYGYAVAKGARIVNASFGGSSFSQSEYNAIKAAPNVLFVAAAGNETANDDTTPSYPCAYNLPNILCVAATDNSDHLASFSNYGRTSVDIAAPGVSIYSTYRCDGYAWMSGTSMAAPEVSGAAALVLAKFPALSATALRAKLLSTADALNATDAPKIAGGRLDVARAVGAAFTPTTPPGSTTSAGDGSGSSVPGDGVRGAARRRARAAGGRVPVGPGPHRHRHHRSDAADARRPDARDAAVPVDAGPARHDARRDRPRRRQRRPDRHDDARRPRRAPRPARRPAPGRDDRLRARLAAGRPARRRAHGQEAPPHRPASSAVTIATGTASPTKAGRTSVTVRVSAKAKRALARLRSVKVSLRATATDAAGNGRTRAKTLTLTR